MATTPTSSPSQVKQEPFFIKMEQIFAEEMPSTPNSSSTPSSTSLHMSADTPRPTESSSSKPTKKRKSWGQVLPEPKTNLPPRKRAKTADEKEQRRIERVKRNRLAAHNSRERKRQEVDALQDEKHALEQRVRDMEAELAAYRSLFPQAKVPKAAPLQHTVPFQGISILESYKNETSSSTIAPSQASFESPDSLLSNLDSPIDTAPSTPGTEMMNADSDPTQHSAVSVGYQQFHHFDAKVPNSLDHHHSLQYPDLNDDGSLDNLFDFNLFPDSGNSLVGGTESFFDSSFGEPTHLSSTSDLMEPLDAGIFDMQPGAGATSTVSDAPGFAA